MLDRRLLGERVVRHSVAAAVALGLVSTAAVVIQALALSRLLAAAMGSGPVDPWPALALLAGAFVVKAGCSMAAELVASRGAEASKAALRSRLLGAVLFHAADRGVSPGQVATLAGRGVDALDPYLARCLPDLVLALAVPATLTVVIGGLDWVSAIVVALVLLLFPLFGYLVGASSGELARRRWRQVEAFGTQVADVFEGLPILKAMGHSVRQRQRIAIAGDALSKASLSTLRVAFLSALVLDTLASVSVALVAVPLGLRLLQGSLSLASALAVLIVAPEVFLPLRRASADFHQSTEGLAAAARAMDLIETASRRPASTSVESPADPRSVTVALRNVRFEFADRMEPVLDAATLVIEPGEHVVLVGANGAGKSTAIAALLGFVQPVRGEVTVGASDLRDVDLDAWRRHASYVPEHPALLSASLAENLRMARPDSSDEELIGALEAAGAADFMNRLSHGLKTRLGDGGRPVSAGERQRIALARAFLRDGSFYVLDEPTAHLDAATETRVVSELEARLRGRSALIVTHRPALLRLGRVVALEDGEFKAASAAAVPA